MQVWSQVYALILTSCGTQARNSASRGQVPHVRMGTVVINHGTAPFEGQVHEPWMRDSPPGWAEHKAEAARALGTWS